MLVAALDSRAAHALRHAASFAWKASASCQSAALSARRAGALAAAGGGGRPAEALGVGREALAFLRAAAMAALSPFGSSAGPLPFAPGGTACRRGDDACARAVCGERYR